jgi:regulator of sirC expression with transglutaminase-like and TPR domain
MRSFAEIAAEDDPPLDELTIAIAAAFRDVDPGAVCGALDALGVELAEALRECSPAPWVQASTLAELLGTRHRFRGERQEYDHPDNSMLDLVLERRRGLPILLSVVYAEVARRAGVRVLGVGLPGHFVVGHFGTTPPLLLDPFDGGCTVETKAPPHLLRPWPAQEIAMRMLNTLVGSFERRGDLASAMKAAMMRQELPTLPQQDLQLEAELRGLRARLN